MTIRDAKQVLALLENPDLPTDEKNELEKKLEELLTEADSLYYLMKDDVR